jgi:glycosyltransferase involved in cell wall biosynthesis
VVVATAPPIAAVAAAWLSDLQGVPLVVELRDLWAGNPAYDAGGPILTAVERRLLRRAAAVVVVTPEAAEEVRRRHPALAERIAVVPNGFEPCLLSRRADRARARRPITLVHSGTLLPARPVRPLLDALARRRAGVFRLVLHGYLDRETAAAVAAAPPGVEVDVVPPSGWDDAVARMAAADVGVVLQSAAAGDATAAAGKVYEYLALGLAVLCVTDGGATEALLTRLGADALAVRLGDAAALDRALDRLEQEVPPEPVPVERLLSYSRDEQARQLADLLSAIRA